MITRPSLDDLLEGVQASLQADVLPAVTNPKAQAMLMVAQGIIQMVRQAMPVYEENLVTEHNRMVALYGELAAALQPSSTPEAGAIRERAGAFAVRDTFPAPISKYELVASHTELSQGLVDTLCDLDVLQRAGDESADRLVAMIRASLMPVIVSDVQTFVVGAGLIGRG